MKKVFFALIFFSFMSVSNLQAKGCPSLNEEPEIEYYTSYGQLGYDFKKNQLQITKLARQHNIIERGMFASGLAIADIQWEISLSTKGTLQEDGSACIAPVKINLFIGYNSPMIYVANHLKKGTCEYDVVLRHEQTHQQINKKALEYFHRYFYKQAQKIAQEIKPIKIKSFTQEEINRATEEITQHYSQKLTPVLEHFKQELKIEHSKLDNPENYGLESLLCK